MSNMDTFVYEIDFLSALALTVSIEAGVVYALLYYFNREKISIRNVLLGGVLPSFATLPYLWFILPIFFMGDHTLYISVGEFSVTLVEAFILQGVLQITFRRALVFSIVANFCSYIFGVF